MTITLTFGIYAVLMYALHISNLVIPLFYLGVSVGAVFYLSSILHLKFMRKVLSVPTVFIPQNNFGPKSFEMQAIIYDVLHKKLYSRIAHGFSWCFDSISWFIVAYLITGWIGLLAVFALCLYQAWSVKETKFFWTVLPSWLFMLTVSLIVTHMYAEYALVSAQYVIVAQTWWRVVSHAPGPLPPGTAKEQGFVLKTFQERLPMSYILPQIFYGYNAEFASGLPFRLNNIAFYLWFLKFTGYQPQNTMGYSDMVRKANDILKNDWDQYSGLATIELQRGIRA